MAKIKNKQELISKIKNAEGFSNEEKSQMLALLNENKTYGLVWENSTEDAWEMMKDNVPVLKEDVSKGIENGREDPNHILIEGDNLNALTALTYTHEGKIDVIYIDPPYNTGKKDFIYYDDFYDEYRELPYVDKEDSYRHSKWLSFMERRLKIAKSLLSSKGVVFISIDDNEQAQLKMLCDEVFCYNNFVGQLIIKTATDNNPSQINIEHEYMLCYAKNKIEQDNWERTSRAAELIIEKYNELKSQELSIDQIQKQLRKWINSNKNNLPQVAHYNNVDEKGVFSSSSNSSNPHPGEYMYDILHPTTHKPCPKPENGWRWPYETFLNYDLQGEVLWGKDETTQPHIKKRIETSTEYLRSMIYEDNRGTTAALTDMFGGKKVFDNPKPVKIISRIIDYCSNKESIILDFFAGSGTTMHATIKLNNKDGGHRQCILVTSNENNICEEVTYERNKRVIEGYTTPKGDKVEGLKDNNLRYFKVGFTPREKTDENMFRLAKNSVNLLRIKHDVYKETQFGELENPYKRYRYFEEDGKQLLVILDTELIGDIVEQLEEMEVSKPIPTYVFTTGAYPFTEDFESVADKVELYPLPHGLYQACERNMPKMIDKEIENPEGISLSNEELETSMDDLTKEEA